MPLSLLLIGKVLGKVAITATPVLLKEGKKIMYISKREKQIKELETIIYETKLEIGSYLDEKYVNFDDIGDKILEAKLLSISDIISKSREIEENIEKILSRYSETDIVEIREGKNPEIDLDTDEIHEQLELETATETKTKAESEEIMENYNARDIERARKMLQDG